MNETTAALLAEVLAITPPCAHCGKPFETLDDILGVMIWRATSPIMDAPSPPITTCDACTLLIREFFHVGPGAARASGLN